MIGNVRILEKNQLPGKEAWNALAKLLRYLDTDGNIQAQVMDDGGLFLSVNDSLLRRGGGSTTIASSDHSITVTPTSSGYDIKSAITVEDGTNITVSRSGNVFTVSAPNMVTALSVRNVYTLQPGSQAWAEISGSGASRVLDLGIPQGAKGDPGASTAVAGASPVSVAYSGNTATVALNGLSSSSSGIVVLRNGTFSVVPIGSGVLVGADGSLSWVQTATCEDA